MYKIKTTNNYIHIEFEKEFKFLSSAVLNGGFVKAKNFLNYKVPLNKKQKTFEEPKLSLQNLADKNKFKGKTVAMMTAAFMKSCKSHKIMKDGVLVEVVVTSGLSNSRRAGDRADYPELIKKCEDLGTINIICICNTGFTDSAMVEALMIISEAKAATLQDLGIKSKTSNLIATGTGTDSTAIACYDSEVIEYCGKHVLLGEIIAKCTIEALKKSIKTSNPKKS